MEPIGLFWLLVLNRLVLGSGFAVHLSNVGSPNISEESHWIQGAS